MTPAMHSAAHPASLGEPINLAEESSVNYWVQTLACSELDLRMAVAEVGPLAGDVGNELGRVL